MSDLVLTLDAYQSEALRTAAPGGGALDLAVLALGVAGEAGEVADYVKKVVGHGHPLDPQRVVDELSDVMWYIAVLAYKVGFSLSEVATHNVQKLHKRYPGGFSTEKSLNRIKE